MDYKWFVLGAAWCAIAGAAISFFSAADTNDGDEDNDMPANAPLPDYVKDELAFKPEHVPEIVRKSDD